MNMRITLLIIHTVMARGLPSSGQKKSFFCKDGRVVIVGEESIVANLTAFILLHAWQKTLQHGWVISDLLLKKAVEEKESAPL